MNLRLGYKILIGMMALSAMPLAADIVTVTLDTSSLTGIPNGAVTFSGTLLNNSGAEVFLNGAGGNLTYSELTLDTTPFFNFTPFSLLDGESYNGPLFAVAISGVALAGDYSGTFIVQGGADASTFDTVGTADFQVTVSEVSTVPEPSTFLLLVSYILVFGCWKGVRMLASHGTT
jgi:hypothetical protein